MLQSVLGLLVFAGIAWLLSENRKKVSLRLVAVGFGLQLVVAALFFKAPVCRTLFLALNKGILAVQEATRAGTAFVFGYIGGGPAPFEVSSPNASFVLAFQGLPIILFMSALSALLFYFKVIPFLVKCFSRVLQKTMGIGGAEGVGVSANIFMGMVESPLFVRPYLKDMTRSELFSLMVCGMATIAGTVMVLYAYVLKDAIPDALGHILTASIISLPAAITIAKIIIPETGECTAGEIAPPREYESVMDAITAGTLQGVKLLLNVTAMLVVLVAFVWLINFALGALPEVKGGPVTLQRVLGFLMAPVTWLMGIPWDEAVTAGGLMGIKTILNEFLAYLELAGPSGEMLSEESRIIMLYAMCGFANPGSLGIMIGGMGGMAPERRQEILALGFRSIVAGTLATCMTGAVAGIFSKI